MFALVSLLLVLALNLMGRRWWCACGSLNPWAGQIWSSHCSQHCLDPYSLTHVLHGFLICFALWSLGCAKLSWSWRFRMVALLETVWELLENSSWMIERYRTQTAALDYSGDSIVNSLFDLISCLTGFCLASGFSVGASAAFFFCSELLLILWLRDSLLLNIWMLAFQTPWLKAWQEQAKSH